MFNDALSYAHQPTSFLRNGLRLVAFTSFAFAASRSNRLGESAKLGRVDIAASSSSACFVASVAPFFDRELAIHVAFKPDAMGNLLLCNMLSTRHQIKLDTAYFFPAFAASFILFFLVVTSSRSFGWSFFLPFVFV